MASPKPVALPRWADVGGNLSTPSSGQQDTGWTVDQVPSSGVENWKAKNVYEWIRWLSEQIAITNGRGLIPLFYPDTNPMGTATLEAVRWSIESGAVQGGNYVAVGDGVTAGAGKAIAVVRMGHKQEFLWENGSMPGNESVYLRDVAFGGAVGARRWVAVGDGGAIFRSGLGSISNFTAQTSGVANNLKGIAWDATHQLWIATGADAILTSPDAATWTAQALPFTAGASPQVIYGRPSISPTGIVMFSAYQGNSARGKVVRSTNGTTYAAVTVFTPASFAGSPMVPWLPFSSGGFFAAVVRDDATSDSRLVTSADGVSWTNQGNTLNTGAPLFSDIAFENDIAVAIGASLVSSASSLVASYDGLSWREIGGIRHDDGMRGLCIGRTMVVVGPSGRIAFGAPRVKLFG